MDMKNFIIFVLILLGNNQIQCLDSDFNILVNITGTYPPYVVLGYLNKNDVLKIKILVPGISSISKANLIQLRQGTLANDLKFITYINVTSGNTSTYEITQTANYYIISRVKYIPRFSLVITINQTKIDLENNSDQYSYYYGTYISKYFNFIGQCTITIDNTQFSDEIKNTAVYVYEAVTYNLITNLSKVDMKGLYFMNFNVKEKVIPFGFSIPIYYNSSKQCSYQQVYKCNQQDTSRCKIRNGYTCSLDGNAICIPLCGNGVLDAGEDCDGVNYCTTSCKPETGYICYANNTCANASKCGDGKLDTEQYCDSVPHCIQCKAQAGYLCSNNTCYNCGNSILQVGQQCDNGNKPGCQSCKVVSPYKCKSVLSTSSVCFICGNSIYELGQECDNGNKNGCTNCTLDRGYKCKSKINAISNCTSICGDSILTDDQQCDNGNMTGCINCLKDANYNCTSLPLKPSRCYNCGNYIIEAGEQCDNNNKKGCIGCKIQPGYNCRADPRYCYLIKQICGNGQRQIQEQCDDGNKINGDGCSSQCKTETGYTCTLALGGKSNCQLLTSHLQASSNKK